MFEDSLFTPMEEEREKTSITGSQFFINFLNQLEGWKTKCKNLHWAAPKKNIHVYLDEFLEVLCDIDFIRSKYLKSGLEREKCLCKKENNMCTFRWKNEMKIRR